MSFKPLKEGLDEWKRTQESIELAKIIINPPKPQPIIIPLERKTERRAERVIHGEVAWKPINREAAMLISKAPWWAHAVPDIKEIRKVEEEIEPKKPKKIRKHKNMNEPDIIQQAGNHGWGSDPKLIKISPGAPDGIMINMDEMTVRILDRINKHPQQLTPLARAAVDARNVLHESMSQLGGVLEDFGTKSKLGLEDIRQTRFSMVSEINHMSKELKEVRQFFMGPDYKEEITRLREFVDLCERLQKLKESGMLDAIGDTMIKLAQ